MRQVATCTIGFDKYLTLFASFVSQILREVVAKRKGVPLNP